MLTREGVGPWWPASPHVWCEPPWCVGPPPCCRRPESPMAPPSPQPCFPRAVACVSVRVACSLLPEVESAVPLRLLAPARREAPRWGRAGHGAGVSPPWRTPEGGGERRHCRAVTCAPRPSTSSGLHAGVVAAVTCTRDTPGELKRVLLRECGFRDAENGCAAGGEASASAQVMVRVPGSSPASGSL